MSADATPLASVVLTLEAQQGLEIAATKREGRPMSTVDVLAGLMSADTVGAWSTIQLHTTYLDADDPLIFADPEADADGSWHNVPLTATATSGLTLAAQIAADYSMVPVPVGVLALGLLSDPETGACRALLHGAEISHPELMEMVQDEILGVSLEGLAVTPRGAGASNDGGSARVPASTTASRLDKEPWFELDGSALGILAGAVERAPSDSDLGRLLSAMLLDADELRADNQALSGLEDEPSSSVLERVERRFGKTELDPAAVIVACALSRSPRVNEALRIRALTPNELASQLAAFRVRSDSAKKGSEPVHIATIVNGLLTLVTTVLVIQASLDGHLWRLLFVPAVWTGYPQLGPGGTTVMAALFAAVVSPIAGAAHLASISSDLLQARAERQELLGRTGVDVTLKEQRNIALRQLNRRGLAYRQQQQTVRAAIRTARDPEGAVS